MKASLIDSLFKSLEISNIKHSNRLVMAPMTRGFSCDGSITDELIEYYFTRAKYGVGLILTEQIPISLKQANTDKRFPLLNSKSNREAWKKLVDKIRSQTMTKIFAQIGHAGPQRRWGMHPDPNLLGIGPINIFNNDELVVKKMNRTLLLKTTESFVLAARRAKEIGFHGIEIHGAHGYLLDSFIRKNINVRNDEYGGVLENRLRFPLQVIKSIRDEVGEKFPISFRFSHWTKDNYDDFLCDESEFKKLIKYFEAAGVNIFHPSTRYFYQKAFKKSSSHQSLASYTKKLVTKNTTVMAVGSVCYDKDVVLNESSRIKLKFSLENLEQTCSAIKNKEFDLAVIGRAFISEPKLVEKIKNLEFKSINSYTESDLAKLKI